MRGRERFHEHNWRESNLQPPGNLGPLPTPAQQRPRRVAGRPGTFLARFRWWLWVAVAGAGLLVVQSKLDQPESDWRDAQYCANVYAGKVPDYRGVYAAKCSNGAVRRANRQ